MTEFVEIKRKAYAKINLGLDVIRKRPDGYHEVKMIMQTVGIYDELTFRKCFKPGVFISLRTENKIHLPTDQRNLVYQAAQMVREEYHIKEGVEITLEKNIPVAAGMAGGSTDAAAVFHGMKELFSLTMTLDKMKQLGVRLGADIPYCIMGGTALSEGIGEILTPLPEPPAAYLVIAKPDISVSTKFVYENLHADTLTQHPDIDGMVQALQNGSLQGITDRMQNVLERVTITEYPVIRELKDTMLNAGAENALMSGSGPTVFGIWQEEQKANRAFTQIKESGLAKQVFLTGFVNHTAYDSSR